MTTGLIPLRDQNVHTEINRSTRLLGCSDGVDNQRTRGLCTIHVGRDVTPAERDDPSAGRERRFHPLVLIPFKDEVDEERTVIGVPPHDTDQLFDALWSGPN